MIRQVWGWIRDNLGRAWRARHRTVRHQHAFASVLQLIFRWIRDVTGILSAVKKAKALLKKVVKTLRLEVKQAIRLLKDVVQAAGAQGGVTQTTGLRQPVGWRLHGGSGQFIPVKLRGTSPAERPTYS